MDYIPTKITANKNPRTLTINWKDGHMSDLPFSLLRYACPCVECRGGHDQMSNKPPVDVFDHPLEKSNKTDLENIESVGTYGISLVWGDGHSAGIFNWDYLRLLCPCKICRDG